MRRPVLSALFAMVAFASAARLAAQQRTLESPAPPACTGVNHVTWPSINPVWDFCYTRPSASSTPNGSGLELTNVRYKGVLVLGRAHIPILNVKYKANPDGSPPDGCGGVNLCYRDWLFQERAFECAPCFDANGAPASCFDGVQCSGTTTPAKTVCDKCTDPQNPGCDDIGIFTGVAVESLPDRLRLTAQNRAGWYRYIPVWEFFPDGTIQALMEFTSLSNNCVAHTHHHHAYFRLDFDLDGSAGDFIDDVTSGTPQRVSTERNFVDVSPTRSRWRVGTSGSPYVVEVSRNPADGAAGDPLPIPGDFPIADGWALAFDEDEFTDSPNLSTCPAGLNSFDNNENVDGADVVLWVRGATLHEGEGGPEAEHCAAAGPTIRVLPGGPPVASNFHTTAPCRIVDTRDTAGPYGGPALAAGGTRDFVVTGRCGIPASAKSVAVNLTATQPTSLGHLTLFPAGETAPVASHLNFSAGQTRANNAVIPLGALGAVSVRSVLTTGTVHFILDVTGWFE